MRPLSIFGVFILILGNKRQIRRTDEVRRICRLLEILGTIKVIKFPLGKMGTHIGQIKRIFTDFYGFFLQKRWVLKENPFKSVVSVKSVFP
jgi:hypothetical protein